MRALLLGVDPTVVSPGAIWWRDSLGTSGGGCNHITVQGSIRLCLLQTARLPAVATVESHSLAKTVSPGNRQGRCVCEPATDSQQAQSTGIWCVKYDQMIKYVTALRLGTAETEAIRRR